MIDIWALQKGALYKSSFSLETSLNKEQGTFQVCAGKGQDWVQSPEIFTHVKNVWPP